MGYNDQGGQNDSGESTIFIAGLPLDANENHIKDVFNQFGQIESCFVVLDKNRGMKSRGIAFVSYMYHQEAETAIEKTNGMKFWDNTIHVMWAKPLSQEEKNRKSRRDMSQRKQGPEIIMSSSFPSGDMGYRDMRQDSGKDMRNIRDLRDNREIRDYRDMRDLRDRDMPPMEKEGIINDYREIKPSIDDKKDNMMPPPMMSNHMQGIPPQKQIPIQTMSQVPSQAPPPQTLEQRTISDRLFDFNIQSGNFKSIPYNELVSQAKEREAVLERILGRKSKRDIDAILNL